MGDDQLLRSFVEGSHEAFEQLACRYRSLVFGAALRQVRKPELAEDVTQAVFIVLLRKASSLLGKASVGGWLLKVTRFISIDAIRAQDLRRHHERAAAQLHGVQGDVNSSGPGTSESEQLAEVVDAALATLSATDRDALVLRYFQDRSYPDVGRMLGLGEDGARKRVDRATRRLRDELTRRGVSVPVTAIGAGLSALALSISPESAATSAGVLQALGGAATTGADGPHGTAMWLAERVMRRARLRLLCAWSASALLLLVAVIGTGMFRARLGHASRSAALAKPLASASGLIYTVSAGKGGIPVPTGEPGVPVHLDFRRLPDGRPSPLQPPLEIVRFWLICSSQDAQQPLVMALATGETLTVPPSIAQRGWTFTWYDAREVSPDQIVGPHAVFPMALRRELSDGVFDARLWRSPRPDAAARHPSGEPTPPPSPMLVQAALSARTAVPATNPLGKGQ